MNIEKELRRAKRYGMVSFDIFDTLIEREVEQPSDIFFRVGINCFSDRGAAENFRKQRMEAERMARRKSQTGEVTLAEIYKELAGYDENTIGRLEQEEMEVEIGACRPRPQMVALLDEMKRMGQRPVLISDMYLPTDCLVKMLAKCGIEGYGALFVSHEWGCDKVGGRLYEVAQARLGLTGIAHLHYGDSLKADVMGARKAKVTPRFVCKRNWLKRLIKRLYESIGSKCG